MWNGTNYSSLIFCVVRASKQCKWLDKSYDSFGSSVAIETHRWDKWTQHANISNDTACDWAGNQGCWRETNAWWRAIENPFSVIQIVRDIVRRLWWEYDILGTHSVAQPTDLWRHLNCTKKTSQMCSSGQYVIMLWRKFRSSLTNFLIKKLLRTNIFIRVNFKDQKHSYLMRWKILRNNYQKHCLFLF